MNKSGSNREYRRERAADGRSVIHVIGTNRAENRAFIYLARHFRSKGLPVPEVYSVSDDEMEYTQEDLGDTLLWDVVKSEELLEKAIRGLVHIQREGAKGLDWSMCFPVPEFDRRSIFWDLNYFKYCFLKVTGVEIDEPRLEDDFETMADRLLNDDGLQVTGDEWGFMYRDFQARNVMIKNGEPYYIDFQGGRRGPVYYDLASFLWQAKAHYSKELRHRLLEAYIDESGMCFDRERLMHFVLFRTLQVLGAYGYRGLIERKEHFIESIPFAKENMRELFRENEYLRRDYPYLYAISDNI